MLNEATMLHATEDKTIIKRVNFNSSHFHGRCEPIIFLQNSIEETVEQIHEFARLGIVKECTLNCRLDPK